MTTGDNDGPDEVDTRAMAGALRALLEVAADPEVVQDWRIPSGVFTEADYEVLIRAAWRHQFTQDRSQFKKQIKELEETLIPKLVAALERIDEQ